MVAPSISQAADSPGVEALGEYREAAPAPKAIENRFFLKAGRFEIAPHVGYIPNNPFAVRYVGGAFLAYHLNETFSVGGDISFSPDLGEQDLKNLVGVLLDRAHSAAAASKKNSFQQPLDKVGLQAQGGVNWAPLYGKINLVGETVLNFDFYLFGGIALISKTDYVATYNEAGAGTNDIVNLTSQGNESKVGPVIGVGQNYFVNQSVAVKIDARSSFYVDGKPQYDAAIPVTEQRLYSNFTASVGIGVYFPAMKPRLYEF
jgi:outer membrane beta-barrel protein